MFLDVSQEHPHAQTHDEEFAKLPPEKWKDVHCAVLTCTVYGMRAAPTNLGEGAQFHFESGGVPFSASDCDCFLSRRTRHQEIILHADDFVVQEKPEYLEWVRGVLAERYPLKVRGILSEAPRSEEHCHRVKDSWQVRR